MISLSPPAPLYPGRARIFNPPLFTVTIDHVIPASFVLGQPQRAVGAEFIVLLLLDYLRICRPPGSWPD